MSLFVKMASLANGDHTNAASRAHAVNVYSEVQTSRLNYPPTLPSVLKASFQAVEGPPSSAAGNPRKGFFYSI